MALLYQPPHDSWLFRNLVQLMYIPLIANNSQIIYSFFSFIVVLVQNFPVIMGQSTVVEISMKEQRAMLNIFI